MLSEEKKSFRKMQKIYMTTSRRRQMKYPEDGNLSIKSNYGNTCRPQDVSLDDALSGRGEAMKHGTR